MSKIFVITGGTAGVGYESVKKLASKSEFSKLIISSRSEGSAKKAIAKLVESTGVSKEKFGFITMDLNDPKTCIAAVEALPEKVDVIVMNAGGTKVSSYKSTNPAGVTPAFYAMCVGYSIFVDTILKKGKVSAGGRIIYAAGEIQRSIPIFTGFQPYPESLASWKRKVKIYPSKPPSSWNSTRTQFAGMQNYKTYMNLLMNKGVPGHIYIAAVSHGGTATGFYDDIGQPLAFLVKNAAPLFRAVGGMHTMEKAVKRYADASTDPHFESKFKTGSFVASPWSFPRYIGASGPLTDNTPWCKELRNEALQDEAAAFIRSVYDNI